MEIDEEEEEEEDIEFEINEELPKFYQMEKNRDPNVLLEKIVEIEGRVGMVVNFIHGYLITFSQDYFYIYKYTQYIDKIKESTCDDNIYENGHIKFQIYNIVNVENFII